VRCICKKCPAVCSAVLSTSSTWVISTCKHGASAPCNPVSTTPHVAVEAPAASGECCICASVCLRDVMFECPNPAAHVLCQACFENNVLSQIREDLMIFVQRDCAVLCNYCAITASIAKQGPTAPFNMRLLSPRSVYTCVFQFVIFSFIT
jgi:hypothetical protein